MRGLEVNFFRNMTSKSQSELKINPRVSFYGQIHLADLESAFDKDAAHLISCRYADRSQTQDYFENL